MAFGPHEAVGLISLHLLVRFSLVFSLKDFGATYRIDCGGLNNFTSQFNQSWIADQFYTGGAPGLVSEPHKFTQEQEKTLRFFPLSFGKKNCYLVHVPNGRYYIRAFTVYDNYDSKMQPPSFDVSVEETLVFNWRSPWTQTISNNGAYSDVLTFISDGEASICFYSIATDPPIIGSLEIVQVDPLCYDSSSTGKNLILVNYGRLTFGPSSFGSGFTNDLDIFGRVWQTDQNIARNNRMVRHLSTTQNIRNTNQAPNFFPTHLYQTATVAIVDQPLEYLFDVDTRLDYMLWFHFSEIDPQITAVGQRVFDIYIDHKNVTRIDVFREVKDFAAFQWHYIIKNLNNTPLSVKLIPVIGVPLINGLENYAMVPLDISTSPTEVLAMRALKESLKIPDRMGWNGDPCAPSTWDAWEGVTCQRSGNGSSVVVTQLDLGSQGLKGYISDQIYLLSNLVSLNLSSNSLGGNLPSVISQGSLVSLDLSRNRFTGIIPDSLGSSSLQTVLLNENQLEGKVPETLYSIGVHGGLIDLSGNKGLCGVPSLPSCPFFWGKGRLSTGTKIVIGISCVVIISLLILLIYVFCKRRHRNDYDFGLPHDLISIAAKRNRYQRQKSLMLLELESQSSNRFPSALNPI